MTFSHLAPSVLQPDELKLVQGVFDRITSQRWFSQYPSRRADFARYVLTMYMRGPVFPEKLESLCTLAARTHYITSDAHLGGRRILIVDDDYYTAKEAAEALSVLGATVVGPYSNLSDAMDVAGQTWSSTVHCSTSI